MTSGKSLDFSLQIFKMEISSLGHVSSLILPAVNLIMNYEDKHYISPVK